MYDIDTEKHTKVDGKLLRSIQPIHEIKQNPTSNPMH